MTDFISTFEDAAKALRDVLNQWLNDPDAHSYDWAGPNDLHSVIVASDFSPGWHFSEDGLAYHRREGRDFLDIYTQVAFQLGFHDGYLRAENDVYKRL